MGMNYEEDETYDYKLTKEYNWNVKNKASKGYEENFFFCYRPGHGKLNRVNSVFQIRDPSKIDCPYLDASTYQLFTYKLSDIDALALTYS